MKSVLMPPFPIDEDYAADLKNKVGTTAVPRGVRTSGSLSEQLTKHEWEQVGNQSVHHNGKGRRSIDDVVRYNI